MPRLSDEQILRARDIDLLSYLQTHEPSNVRKNRSGEYYMVEHDSLKMSNGKWFRHATQQGGHSALDFLIKVRGIPFVDAVQSLTDGYVISGYQVKSAQKFHANISKALKYAVEMDYIPHTIMGKVKRPKAERFTGKFLKQSETVELFEAVKGHKLELGVIFGAFYGLRRSEAYVKLKLKNNRKYFLNINFQNRTCKTTECGFVFTT